MIFLDVNFALFHCSYISLFRPLFLRPLTNDILSPSKDKVKYPEKSLSFAALHSLLACKNIACFCACVWEATVTNLHQVDEKLFQDLFLFFIRHLFGFLHIKKGLRNIYLTGRLIALQTVTTRVNTNVEQRSVASALQRPLQQRFRSLKGGLRAMFFNSCNFCETNAHCAETLHWCNSAFGATKVEVVNGFRSVNSRIEKESETTRFIDQVSHTHFDILLS